MERVCGRVQTPSKPSEYSYMTHEESEDMSFRVSQLEGVVKRFVRKVYLDNLETSRDYGGTCEG